MTVIGTIGPSSISKKVLSELKELELDSFRINLSHASHKSLLDYYKLFSELSISPSLDTQGAQMRIANSPHSRFNTVGTSMRIGFSEVNEPKDPDLIMLNHASFFDQVSAGDVIKIGFDGLISKIVHVDANARIVDAEVVNPGPVSKNKALDVLGKTLNLDSFTQFDKSCIVDSINHNISEIYLSFCDSASSINSLRRLLLDSGWSNDSMPRIIAKIENKKALFNIHSIIKAADAILIDRGDISREVRISSIPSVVSSIVKKSVQLSKPCYVATNVLDSMMIEELPSRAEISDIFNLLDMGVAGFVLAAEVAIGRHPVESVQVVKAMCQIYQLQKENLYFNTEISDIIPGIQEPLKSWL